MKKRDTCDFDLEMFLKTKPRSSSNPSLGPLIMLTKRTLRKLFWVICEEDLAKKQNAIKREKKSQDPELYKRGNYPQGQLGRDRSAPPGSLGGINVQVSFHSQHGPHFQKIGGGQSLI